MLIAAVGRGCAHCEVGVPITEIEGSRGAFKICLECTMRWFPGRGVDWFETHHAPFQDHVMVAFKLAREIEEAQYQAWKASLIKAGQWPPA